MNETSEDAGTAGELANTGSRVQVIGEDGAAIVPADPGPWSWAAADEDIADDLRRLGVTLPDTIDAATFDQARRDQLASMFLRRAAEEIAEMQQLSSSCAAEMQFVESRYAEQIARCDRRADMLGRAVRAIAANTKEAGGYAGKKKSRDVGAGSYGYKTYTGGPELQDGAAFVEWAKEHARGAVRVKLTLTLEEAGERFTPSELAELSAKYEPMAKAAEAIASAQRADALPPGFVIAPTVDEYFAKPLPAAAIPGARLPGDR